MVPNGHLGARWREPHTRLAGCGCAWGPLPLADWHVNPGQLQGGPGEACVGLGAKVAGYPLLQRSSSSTCRPALNAVLPPA